MKVWLDGKLVDEENARISVFDHGILYGDGVFEGIRIYGGRIFQCEPHVNRLYDSARRIRLAIPYPGEYRSGTCVVALDRDHLIPTDIGTCRPGDLYELIDVGDAAQREIIVVVLVDPR